MPLYASISDLAIGIAWVQASNQLITMLGAATSGTRSALRHMAEDAAQPGAGVRDRRIYTEREELRRIGLWLLPWHRSHLCGKDAQWLYTGIERAPV